MAESVRLAEEHPLFFQRAFERCTTTERRNELFFLAWSALQTFDGAEEIDALGIVLEGGHVRVFGGAVVFEMVAAPTGDLGPQIARQIARRLVLSAEDAGQDIAGFAPLLGDGQEPFELDQRLGLSRIALERFLDLTLGRLGIAGALFEHTRKVETKLGAIARRGFVDATLEQRRELRVIVGGAVDGLEGFGDLFEERAVVEELFESLP